MLSLVLNYIFDIIWRRYLNLGSNNLTSMPPDAFNALESLARLILSENPLTPEVHPMAGLALRKLHFLDLSFTGLSSVPRPSTPMVRDLRLGHNALETVKVEDFENFPHLTLLVLDDNRISQVSIASYAVCSAARSTGNLKCPDSSCTPELTLLNLTEQHVHAHFEAN